MAKKTFLTFLIVLIAFLNSCSHQSVKKEAEDSYIVFIKKTLPKVSKGCSREEVETMLKIPERFNGIILSNGNEEAFSYAYYIDEFRLTLVFNYKNKKDGFFSDYRLERSNEAIN